MPIASRLLAALVAAAGTWLVSASIASACGCFSPPQLPPAPDVTADQYAVSQQAEQIIFEVADGMVTAHVLIRYEGKPETFAWLLPVPTEPELDLSESMAFAILDGETSPQLTFQESDLCPVPNYRCEYHPSPRCGSSGSSGGGCGFGEDRSAAPGASDTGAGFADAGTGGGGEPPVEVISRQVIGAYDTVVFAAGDAMAAVTWLQDEGFIVNDTTTPYMQPYLDAGMLFVASRLVAGAGIEEIRPLKLTYAADAPMIPLQLTAVSAEPHLTVNAFIFSDTSFRPMDQPMTEIDETLLSTDPDGRSNYPMVLARVVDEAGGDAFVAEYDGPSPVSSLGRDPCCQGGFDSCRVRGDGLCQCPGAEFDADDCADVEGLEEGLQLVEDLAVRHSWMTRLSTRLSPEEMSFDPAFVRGSGGMSGRLSAIGQRSTLDRCRTNVVDIPAFDAIRDRQACAATYCGAGSECAVTADGAGCVCGPGMVARAFTDADGLRSVTCASETPLVDFSAGGVALPSACATVDCGFGTCVDLGGFPACRCNPGQAAVVEMGVQAPRCVGATQMTTSPGAEDFTGPLAEVAVCAPNPPSSCGDQGWLVATSGGIRGEECPSSIPDEALFEIPPMQTCDDLERPGRAGGGGGCSAVFRSTPMHLPLGAGLLLVALGRVFMRRRRKR